MAIKNYDAMTIARIAAVVGATTTLSACSGGDQEQLTAATSSVAQAIVTRAVPGDYDGDGKADLALFRPQNVTSPGGWGPNQWHVGLSGGGEVAVSGGDGKQIFVPGDYDGDGRYDFAFFNQHNGNWTITYATGGTVVQNYGADGNDRPVPGDYDGDGKTDLAIFRINPATCGAGPGLSYGCWHIKRSTGGADLEVNYGEASDILVPADYDGDGKTDVGLFRRNGTSATWYVHHPISGQTDPAVSFGLSKDRPVPADYDFDGKVDKATFTPSNGNWVVKTTGTFSPPTLTGTLGTGIDRVVPAAYDGAGAQMAYFRPSDGTWHIKSFNGVERVVTYGEATDRPLNGHVAIYPRSSHEPLPLDFDGDRRDDLAYWTPSTGAWSARLANGGSYFIPSWGDPTDQPAPGDYDGDGVIDPGLFRRANTGTVSWWVLNSSTGNGNMVGGAGIANLNATQVAVPGDYDGDGITDPAWFTKDGSARGYWRIRYSSTGTVVARLFGQNAGDIPVPGDYDNDGRTDLAIYRPGEGRWYVRPAKGGSDILQYWGNSTDIPKPGDFDGDGATDFVIFRPAEGRWYYINSATSGSGFKGWGESTDRLVPRDYDGDGITDPGLWRPSESKWRVAPSTGAADPYLTFGTSADKFL